jgi:hypothetical protein
MKNTIKPLLAGLLLFIPAACLRAQTNVESASSNSVAPAVASMNATPALVSAVPVNTPPSSVTHVQSSDVFPILASFGMPVLVVGMAFFFKYRKDRLAHETLRAMIEKGMPITPELIAQLGRKQSDTSTQPNQSRHLLPGLVMVAVGVALLISNHAGGGIPGLPGAGGWIILFVGVALLIVWFVEKNNKNDAQPPRQ